MCFILQLVPLQPDVKLSCVHNLHVCRHTGNGSGGKDQYLNDSAMADCCRDAGPCIHVCCMVDILKGSICRLTAGHKRLDTAKHRLNLTDPCRAVHDEFAGLHLHQAVLLENEDITKAAARR